MHLSCLTTASMILILFEVSPIHIVPKSPSKIKELMKEKMVIISSQIIVIKCYDWNSIFLKKLSKGKSHIQLNTVNSSKKLEGTKGHTSITTIKRKEKKVAYSRNRETLNSKVKERNLCGVTDRGGLWMVSCTCCPAMLGKKDGKGQRSHWKARRPGVQV